MKIKVLIKENLDKIYNILPVVKNNPNLAESQDLIEYYNDKNLIEVFTKACNDWAHGKFRRFIVIDDYAVKEIDLVIDEEEYKVIYWSNT